MHTRTVVSHCPKVGIPLPEDPHPTSSMPGSTSLIARAASAASLLRTTKIIDIERN